MKILLYLAFGLLLCTACTKESEKKEPELRDLSASIAIAFGYSDENIQHFLEQPTRAFISAYVQFPEDLGRDILFGMDMEWAEGINSPIHFEGADWMSLAGITRDGILQFPIGSPENLEGVPTPTIKWEMRDLSINLSPNTWYKITLISDFQKREFLSFQIEGNGVDLTEDISGYPLEYPNYVPFDKPFLSFYTLALRSKEFAPNNDGGTKVYFDDIEAGVWSGNAYKIVFSNGFEDQNGIGEMPFSGPVSPLDAVPENFWFYENDEARITLSETRSRTGNKSMACDASLTKLYQL